MKNFRLKNKTALCSLPQKTEMLNGITFDYIFWIVDIFMMEKFSI